MGEDLKGHRGLERKGWGRDGKDTGVLRERGGRGFERTQGSSEKGMVEGLKGHRGS